MHLTSLVVLVRAGTIRHIHTVFSDALLGPGTVSAVAIRAYYAQSCDINNEVAAMRIRVRAERRMGELIEREQEAGRLAIRGETKQDRVSSVATSTLHDLGIPRVRIVRAQELARVPQEQSHFSIA